MGQNGPDLSVLSISQLSLVSGKTRETIRKKLDGVLAPLDDGDTRSKRYHAPAALGIIFGTGDGLDWTAEKARLACAQADATEMRNAIARGDVLEREKLQARSSLALAALKSSVQGVPSRIRQQAPHIEPADVAAMRDMLDHALNDFADALLDLCAGQADDGVGEGDSASAEADPLGMG